jgi:hypothetical protein
MLSRLSAMDKATSIRTGPITFAKKIDNSIAASRAVSKAENGSSISP